METTTEPNRAPIPIPSTSSEVQLMETSRIDPIENKKTLPLTSSEVQLEKAASGSVPKA